MPENNKVEIVNLPEKGGRMKVVQVDLDGSNFLVFPYENPRFEGEGILLDFHAEILKAFLEGRDISYRETEPNDDYPFPIPELKGDRYRLVGAGKGLIVDPAHSCNNGLGLMDFTHSGRSKHYEVGLDIELLRAIREQLPDWRVYASTDDIDQEYHSF